MKVANQKVWVRAQAADIASPSEWLPDRSGKPGEGLCKGFVPDL
jgi:hypothetical protein